jgi:hypothetical protein
MARSWIVTSVAFIAGLITILVFPTQVDDVVHSFTARADKTWCTIRECPAAPAPAACQEDLRPAYPAGVGVYPCPSSSGCPRHEDTAAVLRLVAGGSGSTTNLRPLEDNGHSRRWVYAGPRATFIVPNGWSADNSAGLNWTPGSRLTEAVVTLNCFL